MVKSPHRAESEQLMSEENNIAVPDAGADTPSSQPAAVESDQPTNDAGADTPESTPAAAESEVDGNANTKGQEPEGGTEGTGQRKLTLEERAAEIAEKRATEIAEQRMAKMEAELREKFAAPDPPDFVNVDMAAIQSHIEQKLTEVEALRLDGRVLEALDIEDEVRELRAAVKENEAKKRAYMERQAKKDESANEQKAFAEKVNRALLDAAPIVMKGLGATQEAWDAGEKFFQSARQADPLLDAEYRERVMLEGPVRAIRWAAEYTQKKMAETVGKDRQKKEEGKEKTVNAGGDGGNQFANVKNWDDLMKLPSTDINRFAKDHPKRFADIKNKRFA